MKLFLKDLPALLEGCLLVALGLVFLGSSNLLSGGTVGLAFLSHVLIPELSFGQVFFLINLPFYWIGYHRLGPGLLLRTFFCVTLVSVLVDLFGGLVQLHLAYPIAGAVFSAMLLALGISMLFKAGGSLGGVNILGLYLQLAMGWPAARVILAIDILVMLLATLVYGWQSVIYSTLCATLMGLLLGRHFKPPAVTVAPQTSPSQ